MKKIPLTPQSLRDQAFALWQHSMPTHLLSRCIHRATRIETKVLKNVAIDTFMKLYGVNLADYQGKKASDFASFNAFFTRALEREARPLAKGATTLISPVDGAISQLGDIDNGGRIFQAKGHHFTTAELLGDNELSNVFNGGHFATIYLAPTNYHRIHMPLAGTLREMIYIPGKLFSVNTSTVRTIPKVFARNERVVAIFDTLRGPMAMVLVGAMCVGSIETVWAGEITPPAGKKIRTWQYPSSGNNALHLARGDEMGRFNMGSTVILLFPKEAVEFDPALVEGAPVRLGQALEAEGED